MNVAETIEDPIIVTITAPDGSEQDFVQDVVIPYGGREFAVLVSIPLSEDDMNEPEILLARMDMDEEGIVEYVPPTDAEYDAVEAIYNDL